MTRHLAALALAAGCTTAPTVPAVEEAVGAVGMASAPSPVSTLASRTVPRASRSRRPDPRSEIGSQLLDVTCYAETGNRTASGLWPRVGMAASNTYPFGTRLEVENVGVVTVEDRIGHGTDLDLFGPSEAYCRQFGRQHLHVQVAA